MMPTNSQAYRMASFYGRWDGWYPATVNRAIRWDDGICEGCVRELPPEVLGSRRYHEGCRP